MTDSLCRKRKLADLFIPCVPLHAHSILKSDRIRSLHIYKALLFVNALQDTAEKVYKAYVINFTTQ